MSTFTAGPTSPGSQSGSYGGITASQLTLAQSGVLQSVSMFWTANPGTSYILGVYSDLANLPGTLLASSAVSSSSSAFPTLPMSTNPTLAPGKYWVAIQVQTSAGSGYFDTPTGLGAFNGSASWTGAMPSSWPGGGGSGAYTFSLYATFNTVSALSFPMAIADTSVVTALGFRVGKRIPLTVADSSTVTALGFRVIPNFPLIVADSSQVFLGFQNDHHKAPPPPLTVAPYAGKNQPTRIDTPATIAYRQAEREESCWVIPSYQSIFPEVPNAQIQETEQTRVPPAVQRTDIFSAQQTFPL